MGQGNSYQLFQRVPDLNKKIQNISSFKENEANQIIICIEQSTPIVYLPAYLSVKINNIETIVIEQNLAKLNLMLMFSIYFGDLSKDFVNQVCNQLKLSFARDQQFDLRKTDEKKIQHNQQLNQQVFDEDSDDDQSEDEPANIQEKQFNQNLKIQTFMIRKTFETNLTPYCFLTPFQIHDLVLGIQIRKCEVKIDDKNIQVKLNLMSTNSEKEEDRSKCINFSQMGSYGQYDLAEALLLAENTYQRSNKNLGDFFKPKLIFQILDFGNKFNELFPFFKKKIVTKDKMKQVSMKEINNSQTKYLNSKDKQFQAQCKKYFQNKNFQFCNFHFPMYKKPWTSFLTIYLPIWILSFITLCMFYMKNDYTERVGAVAALTLAFIPIIQVVREQIPKTSSFSFVEISILFQIFGSLLFLAQSWFIRNKGEDYQFNAYTNIFFLITLSITSFFFIIPVLVAIIFKFKVEQELNVELSFIDFKFFRNQWIYNYQAEKFFGEKKKLLKEKNERDEKILLYSKTQKEIKQHKDKESKSKIPRLKHIITEKQLIQEFQMMQMDPYKVKNKKFMEQCRKLFDIQVKIKKQRKSSFKQSKHLSLPI